MDGVDEHVLLPFFSTSDRKGVFIEEVGGHHGFGLDPAVLAGDDNISFIVFFLVAGDASVYGFLDDGDFILIGAGDPRSLTAGLYAHGGVLDVFIQVKVGHVHLPNVQRTRPIAPFAVDGSETKVVDFDFPALEGDGFLVDQRLQEIEGVEVVVVEDVALLQVILRHDNLLSAEKGTVLLVEVLLLLVANTVL